MKVRISNDIVVKFLTALTTVAFLVALGMAASTCRTMHKRDYRYEVSQERLDQAIEDMRALGMDADELDAAIKNLRSRYPVKKKEQ